MKKIILLMAIAIIGTNVYAEVNNPGTTSFTTFSKSVNSIPSNAYKKSGYKTTPQIPNQTTKSNSPQIQQLPKISSSDSLRDELDGIAMNMLRAAERHDDAELNVQFNKLMSKGVESYYTPEIYVRPQGCPYKKHITVNGKQMSGNLCAFTGYEYKGEIREVGYCK